MTTFWRDGFWRVSANGNVHWVNGHVVERNDWDRPTGLQPRFDYWRAQLDSVRARSSSAARFITPNATCPECGADVFFYQNEHGSRVYFDDVGPPWPKHPCTDHPAPSRRKPTANEESVEAPVARQHQEITQVRIWLNGACTFPVHHFTGRYGQQPWRLAEVLMRKKGRRDTFLVLRDLDVYTPRKIFVSTRSVPRSVRQGSIVALERGRISFVDLDRLRPADRPIRRYRSALAFVNALVDPSPPR